MKIDLVFLIILVIVVAYIFALDKIETMADVTTTDQIKAAVREIYLADVEAIRNLSNIATKLQADGLTVPGQLTTNIINASDNINVSNKTNEGGRIRILNELKNGKADQTNDWSIWNMTGGYGNKLAFWRYNGDGKNAGPALELYDNGNAVINGDANVNGTLTTKSQINAIRKDGRTTHLDYTDGINYIRGDTQHDNTLTVGALRLRNGNWTDGAVDVKVQEGLWGNWTDMKMCPAGSYVCGLQTRFEGQQDGDDTALNGINMKCCKF